MIVSCIVLFYILYLKKLSLSMRFNSFKLYINHLKQLKYTAIPEVATVVQKYNIVLGNEACDADSVISALCFAYLKSLKCIETDIYIPIVLTSRMDIHLKREVQLLLQSVRLNLDDLICSDEIPQLEKFNSNQLTLTLTDHNKLSSQFIMYSSNVIEIIDHHKDSNEYSWIKHECRNIAFDETTNKALVGSTCTLIAEKFFANENIICSDVATLLMGVIALDTINMNNEVGIGTERDFKMLENLQKLSNHNRTILYETLRDAKLDQNFWNQLNVTDCLKLDYKLFTTNNNLHRIGISSILQQISTFLEKDDIELSLNKFMNDQNLTLLVIMSFVHKPITKRELFIYTNSKHIFESVNQYLLNNDLDHDFQCISNKDLNNKFKVITDSNNQNIQTYYSIFNQGNVKSSRKQIAPKLLLFHENNL